MIHDEQERPMSPAHTRNHGRRYRYYASNRADDASTPALRLPAGELDAAVRAAFVELLQNAHQLIEVGSHLPPHDQQMLVEASSNLATRLGTMSVAAVRALLLDARLEVVLSYRGAAATISAARLLECLGFAADHDHPLTLSIAANPDFRGREPRLRLQRPAGRPTGDPALMQIIASGFAARDQLLAMTDDDVATTSGTRVRHLIRYARLAYLAPDIIRSIMEGRQPRQLTARYLVRCPALPLDWAGQRRMLGFTTN
jgi:hypothetical protein